MLAIDWGTTSFRAYRLDPEGGIVDSRSAPAGILCVEDGNFAGVLEQQAGDWIAAGETPVVMSGMIGSRQGWLEVPYAACPAGLDEIAAGMRRVVSNTGEAWIAPGITCRDETGKIVRFSTHMTGEAFAVLKTHSILGRRTQWTARKA